MSFWKKHDRDRELDDEIESHLRMAAQDRMERGETPEEAGFAARRELGNVSLIKEVTRGMWSWKSSLNVFQDLRYGLRMLRRNPGFTFVSILTLALGISASTAIFSVVYGVLLRPLPYEKPDQLVRVWEQNPNGNHMNLADPNFQDFRAQNHSLQGLAEYAAGLQAVSTGAESQRLNVAYVSSDFFPIMRVRPVIGRGFAPEDQRPGVAPVALVSHSYWKQSLKGETTLSNIKLSVNNQPAAVIGVLPAGFRFPDGSDLWVPREITSPLPSRSAHNWQGLGRLRDGVSVAQAANDLSSIARRIKQQFGDDVPMTSASVLQLHEALTTSVRSNLFILLGAVGFLLLVGCANVMNLLLSQAAAREGELAVRAALGASRARLVRQFMAETLLLSLSGGFVGVLAAYWGVHKLLLIAPPETPRLANVSVNLPVLLFALGLSIAVAVGLGMFTALRAGGGDLRTALVEGGRGQAGGTQRIGRVIIAMQLAITLVLLVGAGLLGRSLLRVLSVDPGFRTENVVTVDMVLPPAFKEDLKVRRAEFLNELFTRLRSLPGVQEVGGTNELPLAAEFSPDGTYVIMNPEQITPHVQEMINRAAHADLEKDQALMKELTGFFEQLFRDPTYTGNADYAVASEGYFSSLGIPLVRGRFFDDRDSADSPHTALISQSLARQKFQNQDPIGRSIEFGNMDGDPRLLTVIGVVGDVREQSLEAPPRPTIYVNYRQRPQGTRHFSVVVRTAGDPAAIVASARKIIRDLDPEIPPSAESFTRIIAASLNGRRFNLVLIGTFAVTALLLAVAGIYGVLAYSVARRTRDIGVRLALGASPGNVLRLVLGQSMRTAGIGVVLGLIGAFVLMRFMRAMLFEVSSADPLTFAAVALVLLGVAMLASYLPARRATRVDPIVALRYE